MGDINYETASFIRQTADGGYIIIGTKSVSYIGYLYLLKIDANGVEQWSKTFGSYTTGLSVQQTLDGGYITTGRIDFGSASTDLYLLKTDENGDEEWSKTFGGTGSEMGSCVQKTTDGGYIITGSTNS